jgi:hypothetical protein
MTNKVKSFRQTLQWKSICILQMCYEQMISSLSKVHENVAH